MLHDIRKWTYSGHFKTRLEGLGQLDITQCISPWPATAACILKYRHPSVSSTVHKTVSVYPELRTCVYYTWTYIRSQCEHTSLDSLSECLGIGYLAQRHLGICSGYLFNKPAFQLNGRVGLELFPQGRLRPHCWWCQNINVIDIFLIDNFVSSSCSWLMYPFRGHGEGARA